MACVCLSLCSLQAPSGPEFSKGADAVPGGETPSPWGRGHKEVHVLQRVEAVRSPASPCVPLPMGTFQLIQLSLT